MNRDEIFNLSAGLIGRDKNSIFSLHYDGVDDRISTLIDLNAVELVEIDEKDLGFRELMLLGYGEQRIWKKPSIFRKLYFKIKWFMEDRSEEAKLKEEAKKGQ